MTVIAQLDGQSPAVVLMLYDYGSDRVPDFMVAPAYRDVTAVNPRPQPGYTYDGATWAPGVPQLQQANEASIAGRAQAALNANATFQALQAPTNAQTLAQVQLLTREANALIRLALGLYDTTAGT